MNDVHNDLISATASAYLFSHNDIYIRWQVVSLLQLDKDGDGGDKRSSLQQFNVNYSCKKFYSAGHKIS